MIENVFRFCYISNQPFAIVAFNRICKVPVNNRWKKEKRNEIRLLVILGEGNGRLALNPLCLLFCSVQGQATA